VDFVRRWSEKAEIGVGRFILWLGVTASKFYDWRQQRYGCVNEHNGWVPRDFWLEPWEKEAIIGFRLQNPLEGYRRLTFMMLDADVVAVSPASVWRVLKQAGLLSRWKSKPSRMGTGFEQPLQPHQHWHIDVSYINLCGTFYYLCSVRSTCARASRKSSPKGAAWFPPLTFSWGPTTQSMSATVAPSSRVQSSK
jgi:putative transposase